MGAALAAVLAFTAVPTVLVTVVGDPLAGGLGRAWRPAPRDALCLLVLAAWVAWAACCTQLLRAVVAHVRNGEVGMRQGASVMDRLAARIAFGVLALTAVGGPLGLTAGAGASTPVAGTPGAAVTAPRPVAPPASTATYAVQPGDTLWHIADDHLGDGADWTMLAALNLGRDMGSGMRFVDPDQLRAGWELRLPAYVRATAPDPPRVGPTTHTARGEGTGHLPELLALGLGSLACAALARRAGRRRRMGARFTEELGIEPLPSESAQDAATLLERFAGVPALHSFEAANCLLGRSLHGRDAGPRVRAICVSPSGVTFWLADEEPGPPPEGFVPVRDDAAWQVGHGALDVDDLSLPYLPVVLPIGDDADGTWLIPLEPGDVLPLLGEGAPALWRAARAAAGSWAWSDTVLISEDPEDPGIRSEVAAEPALARPVLFCGDPRSLPDGAAPRCAVVTMAPVAASDLTVLVDRRGATLHPMGRVVRPHLQATATARHIEELVVAPADDDARDAGGKRRRDAWPAAPRTRPRWRRGRSTCGC